MRHLFFLVCAVFALHAPSAHADRYAARQEFPLFRSVDADVSFEEFVDLVRSGADVLERTADGWNLLHAFAAATPRTPEEERLLYRKLSSVLRHEPRLALPEYRDQRTADCLTPVMVAAKSVNLPALYALAHDARADLRFRDESRRTARGILSPSAFNELLSRSNPKARIARQWLNRLDPFDSGDELLLRVLGSIIAAADERIGFSSWDRAMASPAGVILSHENRVKCWKKKGDLPAVVQDRRVFDESSGNPHIHENSHVDGGSTGKSAGIAD